MMPSQRQLRRASAGILLALATAACGPGSTAPSGESAATFLQRAKSTFDRTSAFHIELTSSNASGNGIVLERATGDAARPDKFSGTLTVEEASLPLQIPVVSVGGKFYVKGPFSGAYVATSPSQYGFGDPGQLLSPTSGISTLLPATQDPALGQSTRLNGEQLQQVTGTLPGEKVKQLLLDADPSRPVAVVYSIDPSTYQLREVDLTGPIFQAGSDSTFHLVLTSYGEAVTITPPS
jgi:hypothetical protein